MFKKNKFPVFVFFIFLNICAFAAMEARASESWLKIKTENFTVIGNAGEDKLRKIASEIEEFRQAIKQIAPEFAGKSSADLKIIVFRDDKSFHEFKPAGGKGKITGWVSGFFQSGLDTNYIAFAYGRSERQTFRTLFHEYVHFLIDNHIARHNVPPWFNEGLAEFYDGLTVKSQESVRLGNLNRQHLKTLKNRKLMPLREFFSADYKSLRTQNQSSANLFYAQSWALMNYLQTLENGGKKPKLEGFLRSILAGKDSETAFEESFRMNFREMEAELENFIENGRFKSELIKLSEKIETENLISADEISGEEAGAYLGDLLNQRENLETAEKILTGVIAKNPGVSLANSSLGLLKFKQNKHREARSYFQKALENKDRDHLAYFRYAYFLSREDLEFGEMISNYPNEKASLMRTLLKKSIELEPDFAESFRLLGFINLVRREKLEEGIEFLKKAIELQPVRESFRLNLGDLYFRRGDFENARRIAENLLESGAEMQSRRHAEILLSKVKFALEQIEIVKRENYVSENLPEQAESKPKRETTEKELERNRRKTLSEAISEVLRKPLPDEKRFVGYLSEISCVREKIIYKIKISEDTKKLQSLGFENLFLRSYSREMGNFSLDCGAIKKDTIAVVTYKPAGSFSPDVIGNLIAIEFVPENFTLSEAVR